jgi:hypothetical protein
VLLPGMPLLITGALALGEGLTMVRHGLLPLLFFASCSLCRVSPMMEDFGQLFCCFPRTSTDHVRRRRRRSVLRERLGPHWGKSTPTSHPRHDH